MPNKTKTDSSLIGKQRVIYGSAENLQDDKIIQIEKDRNSSQQKFKHRIELKENSERLF